MKKIIKRGGFIIVICILFFYLFSNISSIIRQYDIAKSEQTEYESQIKNLEVEQENLKNILNNKNSKEYIEYLAREKLGYSYPNEIVFRKPY